MLFAHPQLVHLNPSNIVYPPHADQDGKNFDEYQLGVSLLSLATQKPTSAYITQTDKGIHYNPQAVKADIHALDADLKKNNVSSPLPQVISKLTNEEPAQRGDLPTNAKALAESEHVTKVIAPAH